jgi:hypothetical protein
MFSENNHNPSGSGHCRCLSSGTVVLPESKWANAAHAPNPPLSSNSYFLPGSIFALTGLEIQSISLTIFPLVVK